MTTLAANIFHYLRGGVQGTFGSENLRGKKILIFGMGDVGQQLLSMLCFHGPEVLFYDESIVNYSAAHRICKSVRALSSGDEEDADIIIDLLGNRLSIDQGVMFKTVNLSQLGEDPYTQGIHDFYL